MGARDVVNQTVAAPVAAVLEDYRAFLVGERGLAAESVRCYCNHARVFLAQLPDPVESGLRGLSAGGVTAYVVAYCQGRNTWSAKAMVTALRSLLRYLHVSGRVPTSLAGAVPAVAGWRLAALPRGLMVGQVDALIASCDLQVAVGVRDHAVLVVLARLGLRTAEVAALGLQDVDWRAGEVLVRGKGGRVERLPLPVAVGEALTGYLIGVRPTCQCRSVFLTARGRPPRPLTAMAVRQIVARACRRAGLPRLGAHRLRHTLASDMLRAGIPLAQVGQVLRHRSQLSTAIYAKVDHTRLRDVARPWPGQR
ncbi:MAG TPA: tyrosine-type recombinase/integrase [Pseudonocardiaceae bacterium]|jgi:site-specific recombinase XerD|nr:tyrosine-type recombinase/integrase [Pseudonocardiaceae bacterium]